MAEADGATLVARSLKKQGVQFMFGIVGFPVQPIAAAAARMRTTSPICRILWIGMTNQSISVPTGWPGFRLAINLRFCRDL